MSVHSSVIWIYQNQETCDISLLYLTKSFLCYVFIAASSLARYLRMGELNAEPGGYVSGYYIRADGLKESFYNIPVRPPGLFTLYLNEDFNLADLVLGDVW
ncbi:OLC1v1006068C1 [Oldenlandia corymbosa var. corymbosa]|uniref:OLC1v1006068C1 n=1 Tax=Oldenlandia corymbosa var. corymbosa TaxID=529605 RepID=A0AAV1DGG2_OLDCO|nr:OLC1v1006068C1 [Oldenlandia corymbosa var. corymbosa]